MVYLPPRQTQRRVSLPRRLLFASALFPPFSPLVLFSLSASTPSDGAIVGQPKTGRSPLRRVAVCPVWRTVVTSCEGQADTPVAMMSTRSSSEREGDVAGDLSSTDRRAVLSRFGKFSVAATVAATGGGQVVSAGEVGTRINAAVTQSDLGVSVRRSVVRGAQIVDKLDGRWEKFSDEFGLGSERFKREGRLKPRDVPDPLPLDAAKAQQMLKASDSVRSSLSRNGWMLGRELALTRSLSDVLSRPFDPSKGISLCYLCWRRGATASDRKSW